MSDEYLKELEDEYQYALSLVETLMAEMKMIDQFMVERGITKDEYQSWKSDYTRRELH